MTESDELLKLSVADGSIEEVSMGRDGVSVRFVDWQEKRFLIKFIDAIGCEWMSPEGEDLSHIETHDESELIDRAVVAAEESNARDPYHEYAFISAWSSRPVLKVVARRAVIADAPAGTDSRGTDIG